MARPRSSLRHWLVKSDPDTYGWDDLVKDGGTRWDGVRNAQARNHLAEMGVGDLVLVYHSNAKEVVGVAKVTKAAYPDPTADDERWVAVELAPIAALRRAVTLAAIKSEPALATIGLVRQGRLSVMPIEDRAFARILALGDTVLRGARAGRAPHDLTTKSPFR